MIPQSFIQDLTARADIVEVVGRHVELKKAGINYKGLCPFHGEKTPSFIVSPTRQTYHCFGCGVHGNAVGFLMEHGGLNFVEAVRELAQNLGVSVPEEPRSAEEQAREAKVRQQQVSLGDVLARAGTHWRKQLRESPRAIDYLKRRGLTGQIAARFGLGYAPGGWHGLASAFEHYDDPLLVEAGLVIEKAASDEAPHGPGHAGPGEASDGRGAPSRRYDRFRDRIMFPIRNPKGDVIGFGGRVLDGGEPKYLNSPETPVFVKGRELYGLFEARQAIRQRGYVLVTEGYMDVVALAQMGFGNAVATLGTACTADHVQKLVRYTDQVVFSFDGDAAGQRAAARAMEAVLPHASDTRQFRFLFLPGEHDPDSYIRAQGTEAFEARVAEAVTLSSQLLSLTAVGCDLATPEGRSRMLATAQPLWRQLPDGLLREQLLAEFAVRGGLTAEVLTRHWMAAAAPSAGPPSPAAARAHSPGSRPPSPPRSPTSRRAPLRAATTLDRAAWLLLNHAELWLALSPGQHDLLFQQPAPHGAFFAALERVLHDEGALPAAALTQALPAAAHDDGTLQALLSRLAQLHDVTSDGAPQAGQELNALLVRLQLQAVEDEINLLQESGDLSDPALQARHRALINEHKRLKQKTV